MLRKKPKLNDIKFILSLYEDGVHSSPEAIINVTDYIPVYVYRIIYWYRVHQLKLKDISDYLLRTYIKPLPHISGVYQ